MTPTRYLKAADENALFCTGVVSWRLDVQTSKILLDIIKQAQWVEKDTGDAPFAPAKPFGILSDDLAQTAKNAVENVLNDPTLFPNLRQMGRLTAQDVELQNGAFDDNWHHDHLSNKRGHAGQFFFIAYMGEKTWDKEWGGGFHYGQRHLRDDWAHNVQDPEHFESIWPSARTALLGWNENPCLIHRAQFLTAPKDRTAFLMPINIIPHTS